jgi:hypothetical protein
MVRTERLAISEDRDGMIDQVPPHGMTVDHRDLETYLALQKMGRLTGHPDTMEYWKAAPYLLSFMDQYALKRQYAEHLLHPDSSRVMKRVLAESQGGKGLLLSCDDVVAYAHLDPGNARLRSLLADTVEAGAWRLLWIPPSLPYYRLAGPFARPTVARLTKRLVFSSWKVVPRAVSALGSYEAERQMIRCFSKRERNSPEDRQKRRPLLRFARTAGRLTGMAILGLLYPSSSLAQACNPLALAADDGAVGMPTRKLIVERARRRIDALLEELPGALSGDGPADEAWYWAAPILFDLQAKPEETRAWFAQASFAEAWAGEVEAQGPEEDNSGWAAHVDRARELVTGRLALGGRPADLSPVLAQTGIAGFGVCALRALGRVSGAPAQSPSLERRNQAGRTAWGFLRLFNHPETTALVRGTLRRGPYWKRVLAYSLDGGMQALLDEYAHVLRESLGLLDKPPDDVARAVSRAIANALTLRTSTLQVEAVGPSPSGDELPIRRLSLRSRFALAFSPERVDEGEDRTRAEQVREAFNSPFWPFVLITTSIGQEGLDFHPYCHAVVHWNLPSNPVDFEQREGRVHRYKGHAVRKNLASHYGLAALTSPEGDPWESLFAAGQRDRPPGQSDLVPFWVYTIPGGAKIERHVPTFPLSLDQERLRALLRSLTVYRMVFGQNRQEDLLAFLLEHVPASELAQAARDLRINLEPPHRE